MASQLAALDAGAGTDAGVGTSRTIVEKGPGGWYGRTRAMVRGILDESMGSRERARYMALYEVWRRAPWALEPESEVGDAFLGAMLTEGVWDAHAVAWDHLGDVLAVEEERSDGLLVVRPRVRVLDRLRRIAGTLREFVTLAALAIPDELAMAEGNVFFNEGTTLLWNRFTGVGAQDQLFDNAHMRIGVTTQDTAATRQDTALDTAGTGTTTFKAQEAGFPTVTAGGASTGSLITAKSIFGSGDANHAWKKWGQNNKGGTPAGTKTLNAKQQDMGLKASGAEWTLSPAARVD